MITILIAAAAGGVWYMRGVERSKRACQTPAAAEKAVKETPAKVPAAKPAAPAVKAPAAKPAVPAVKAPAAQPAVPAVKAPAAKPAAPAPATLQKK